MFHLVSVRGEGASRLGWLGWGRERMRAGIPGSGGISVSYCHVQLNTLVPFPAHSTPVLPPLRSCPGPQPSLITCDLLQGQTKPHDFTLDFRLSQVTPEIFSRCVSLPNQILSSFRLGELISPSTILTHSRHLVDT